MTAWWDTKPLGEVCGIGRQKSVAKQKLTGSDMVSFAPMANLAVGQKYLEPEGERRFEEVAGSYTYFEDGDVLLAKITPCFENGKLGIARGLANGVGFGSSEFVVFQPPNGLMSEFLYYCLASDRFRVEGARRMSGAVGHKRVSKEFIESFQIPLPPLEEQKRIVKILDAAFADLDALNRNLEAKASLIDRLFLSLLNKVYFSSGSESAPLVAIGDFAEHKLGKMLDKRKNRGTPKPYLRNANVRWFEFDLSDVLDMKIEDGESERYEVRRGDLMICEGGYPGRCAIWGESQEIYFQKAVHRVRFDSEELGHWVMYYLYLLDQTGRLSGYFSGTGIQHFTGQALDRFQIPMPSREVRAESIKRLEGARTMIETMQSSVARESDKTDALRQSLLHRAFAGQL